MLNILTDILIQNTQLKKCHITLIWRNFNDNIYNGQNTPDNVSSNLASTSYQNSYQELHSIKIDNGEDDDNVTMENIEEEEE